ncbi:MAG: hypothetical protein WD052_10510 [Bacteroidales bacterium]
MIRKIIHIVVWALLICWFTVIMGFVSKRNGELICREIVVNISDTNTVRFITNERVRELIKHSGINTQGYPVEFIGTRGLEFMIEKDPYVDNAEVYINVEGTLFVDIVQRRPLIRVMPGGKQGYYIDDTGVILPLSDNYSPMVMLLTGAVNIPFTTDESGVRRVDLENHFELKNLLSFAGFVEQHPFWNKQIMQVYRSAKGEFDLIPRVGAHQIEFGKMENYEIKLRNLKLLYDQGLKSYGWNSYDKINLKYSNQIICTKR